MSQIQLGQHSSAQSSEKSQKNLILRVDGLKVYFQKRSGGTFRHPSFIKAVDNVSFEIYESEVVSLVGESGSGKTTIARCISLLTKPSSGTIQWLGKNITAFRGRELRDYRRDVQIIYQDPFESIYSRYDVFTTISTPLICLTQEKNKTVLKELVSQLMVEVGLDPSLHMNRLPHQLSGGQRQRVNIARALASKPKLLIADEPITLLDASQRLNILSLLMKLKEERNLTVLLITHDLASAKVVSDRTGIMYMGRIVEEGSTERILSNPHHPYAETILQAMPDINPNFSPRESESVPERDEAQREVQGCNFRPRCKFATEICGTVDPELLEKTKGHFAACHNPLNMNKNA